MNSDVKKLSLADVILRRRGSFVMHLVRFVFGVTVSLFFRRVELVNSSRLPEGGGLIFVMNHPNALVDPALVFVALPRRIAFLAKSTLFKIPLLGRLIRQVGALPLYRRQDEGEDVSRNRETFTVARELLKAGGAIALFPEGVSHNSPKLLPLKTGAARIALGAVSTGKNPANLDLRVVPVGLFYTNKTTFRSEALLHFGEPLAVAPVPLGEDGQPPRGAVRALTAEIESALREVTLNAETEARLAAARVAEEVFTSVTPHEENLAERMILRQRFLAEGENEIDAELERRLAAYDLDLDRLGIESEFLALSRLSRGAVLREALRRSWYLLVFSPLALAGAVLHFPAYQLGKLFAYAQTRRGDFDMASTVKMFSALVLMPLTWLAAAAAAGFYFGPLAALAAVPLSILSGYAALRTLEEIAEMRGWVRAILLFARRRRKFLRLLAERRNLFERLNVKK